MTRLSGVSELLKCRMTAGRDTPRMGFIRPSSPGRLHDEIILPKSEYMVRRGDVEQQCS